MSRLLPPDVDISEVAAPKHVDLAGAWSRKEAKQRGLMRPGDARRTEVFPGRWRKTKTRHCPHTETSWIADPRFARPGSPSNWYNLICAKCKKRVKYCIWRTRCICGHHEEKAA